MPELRRTARIAKARCTREAKFEVVQRHYIETYQANFFVMLYNIYPRLTYVKIKVKPLNSMLCQESGLTQRFSLFGRSSAEHEELPSCLSDTAGSDKDSSEDIYATDTHARYLSLSD